MAPFQLIAQDNMLCVGRYWTEDEGNLMLKEFALKWNDKASWEARAQTIKKGIIEGMQLDKMPKIKGDFNAILRDKKVIGRLHH
ncbi:hypothetical protein Q2T40_01720 [Winogradskyella maritima]|nr:hypothetical protein [Winogradskyella maritima]